MAVIRQKAEFYVNGSYKGDDADDRLMNGFGCKKPKDIYYFELAKGAKHFKEEGSRKAMCEAVEKYAERRDAIKVKEEWVTQVVSWTSLMGMAFCPDKRIAPNKPADDSALFLLCDLIARKAIPSIKSRTIQTAAIYSYDCTLRKRSEWKITPNPADRINSHKATVAS